MKKKLIIILIIVIIILVVIMLYSLFNENVSEEKISIDEDSELKLDNNTSIEENNNTENILLEEEDEEMTVTENDEEIKINIIVNDNTYTATLYNNEAVLELITHFPMTLNMSDLNSNEKYNYLDFSLITNPYTPNKINVGDIKLYGNNCLVVFYKNFSTSYTYTDIGKIDNAEAFAQELGTENITLRFELGQE